MSLRTTLSSRSRSRATPRPASAGRRHGARPAHRRPPCLALLAALAFAACDGNSSPTAPDTARGATVSIVFASDAALRSREATIRALVESSFRAASPRIPIDGVVVAIDASPARIIAGWGVGGFTPGSHRIEIGVDPTLPDASLDARLPSMVAHELHHAARYRGTGYGATLLEAMVSEGLADQFAAELFGQPLPPWTGALQDSEIESWLARARSEFDTVGYDHAAWFFGSTLAIPRWTGYTLGFRLVSDYRAGHGSASAAALVHTPANAFRPD